MNFIESLLGQFGSQETEAIASQVGADPGQVKSVLNQFLPMVAKGLAKNSQSSGGQEALFNALNNDHDGSILNNIMGALGNSQNSNVGGKILGHVFGQKLGPLAGFLGKTSGVGSDKSSLIMKMAAPIVMGFLGKQTRQSSNFSASGIASMLMNSAQEVENKHPKNMGLIGKLLDQDNDGNVMDDLASTGLSMLKNWMR